MKVFNARHFLRHISMPTLKQFTECHVLGARLNVDWSLPADSLPAGVGDAVQDLETRLASPEFDATERPAVEHDLRLWVDDLRRAHLMSNGLALAEFRSACQLDAEALAAFADRDEREIALWMLTMRDKAFRDVELHLAFQAKTNGKYWKKHRIQCGLDPCRDRAQLELFCHDVAKLYKKAGAGDGVHVEFSERAGIDACDAASIQLTIYVEGPVTALAHFTQSHFTRITTRIALETALVYHPATGEVETIVKGGTKNHAAVLELFGKHVVRQPITPEVIEKQRYRLNALRDGLMEPFEDWSMLGVEQVRLRRARLCPAGQTAISFNVEASPDKAQPDAIHIARGALKVEHLFEAAYNLEGATVIVHTTPIEDGGKPGHFSFDVFASGSSTIKNLSPRNQTTARKVLQALLVIDADESPLTEPVEESVAA
jgi:hypothetical protein